MKTFIVNDSLTIVCQWAKTRTAFKHTATLMQNGREIDETKIYYLNRTWECYEFESVMQKLFDRATKAGTITKQEADIFLAKTRGEDEAEINRKFGAIAMVAKMGEIFNAGDTKASNDWKARMIKAGLGDAIQMPEDWESLDEATKTIRLDAVINQLSK